MSELHRFPARSLILALVGLLVALLAALPVSAAPRLDPETPPTPVITYDILTLPKPT